MDERTKNDVLCTLDDARLIQRILKGQTGAFRYIVRRHRAAMVRFVGRMLPDGADVEDVVQDVFVEAYQSLANYCAERAAFPTWLSRVAYYTVLHHLRRKSVPMTSLDGDESLLDTVSDEAADSLWQTAGEAEVDALDQVLSMLRPEDRMLVQLFYYDGKPLTEIAYVLDSKAGTLATRLCRIRKKLYVILKTMERN